MASFDEIEFATLWVIVLMAVGFVAVFAWVLRSRGVFVAGVIGAIIGSRYPGIVHGLGRSTGGWYDNYVLWRDATVESVVFLAVLSVFCLLLVRLHAGPASPTSAPVEDE